MKRWITVQEAAEIYGVSSRYIHYLINGRPESDERRERPPVLKKVKVLPYGKGKSFYLINALEISAYFGVKR
jgi:hypothetical protein